MNNLSNHLHAHVLVFQPTILLLILQQQQAAFFSAKGLN